MNFVFDPFAQKEFEEAYEYDDAQEAGLGETFRKEVWAAVGVLKLFPEIGEEVRPGIRKILIKRFPYKLIFALTGATVYISDHRGCARPPGTRLLVGPFLTLWTGAPTALAGRNQAPQKPPMLSKSGPAAPRTRGRSSPWDEPGRGTAVVKPLVKVR